MKKKLIAILLVATMALSMVGCGGSSSNSASDESTGNAASSESKEVKKDEKQEVVLTESGYSVQDDGYGYVYLYYSATLNNPNEDYALQFPTITITAKAEDGSIVGTTDQVLNYIAPKDSVTFGSLMDCNGKVPATVEITASSGDYIPGNSTGVIPTSNFTISNTSEIVDEYGSVSYTGEIENIGDTDVDGVAITVTLKNNGQIVYGNTTYVDNLTAGSKKAFELSEYNLPEHTEYVISANAWY